MSENTFNLSALAERLLIEGRWVQLAGRIQEAQRLASLHTDIAIALECLAALTDQLASPPSDHIGRAVTEASLLNNAIIHYARATKTTSRLRKTFDLTSRFTPEQKSIHQELVDLRDDAIAHFGTGGSYRGVWQAEVVILQAIAGTVRAGVATRRQTVDQNLLARARSHIAQVAEMLRRLSEEKIDGLTTELNELAAENADLVHREIVQHPLNLAVMMASPDAASKAAASAQLGGYTKGVVRHRGA